MRRFFALAALALGFPALAAGHNESYKRSLSPNGMVAAYVHKYGDTTDTYLDVYDNGTPELFCRSRKGKLEFCEPIPGGDSGYVLGGRAKLIFPDRATIEQLKKDYENVREKTSLPYFDR